MATGKDTIFERFLAPIFENFLIDRDALSQYHNSKDWEKESDRFRQPNFHYPHYYRSQNFHGAKEGYLSLGSAIVYDAVTQYVLLPSEAWVRQGLIGRISCKPRRILDLGCGTGSTTLLLKQAFPQAEVIGLDFSPYMLAVADDKAQKAGMELQFLQGNAAATGFPDASFDLVTASLLFHETPAYVSCNVLKECFRLLKAGGEVLILDGNQATLRQVSWLTEIFEESYIKAYAVENIDAWMGAAGFKEVQTDDVWWMQQVTRGIKPLPDQQVEFERIGVEEMGDRIELQLGG